MLRTCARRGVVGGTAMLVGLAGLTIGQGAAHASPPLPAAQAGPVAFWGPGDPGDGFPLPSPSSDQVSEAFTKVVANSGGSAIGLTADGRVELLGTNMYVAAGYPSDAIPSALVGKKVVDIAGDANYGNGMAVTDTGDVYTWDLGFEGWAANMPTPSQLAGSKAAAISPTGALAAVVKQDGSVVVWGSTAGPGDYGQLTPPALTDAASVFFDGAGQALYALKSDGTLAAWGRSDNGESDLPAVTTDTTDDVNVTDVASAGNSEVALLSDGTLAAWGAQTAAGQVDAPPAATDGKDIVALAANAAVYFAVDSSGAVYEWGEGASTTDPSFGQLPDSVDPANITGLSANGNYATAIQATFGYIAKPSISGSAEVGQTLTAKPATFTATPDSTTGQWLANGAKIAGAMGTTFKLTTAEVGKTITYSETAKRGAESATATSNPTAKVAALSTGGGNTAQPGGGHVTPPVVQNPKLVHDQAKLKRDHAKLKKFKKKLKKAKKAHNAKKVKKLKKKVRKLKKRVKKDKKHIRADR